MVSWRFLSLLVAFWLIPTAMTSSGGVIISALSGLA
jgi:hypothetical protein